MSGRGLLALTSPVAGADPSRIPYEDIHSRYAPLMTDFVKELLLGTDCQPGEYQMGQDMVFFKGSKGAVLQELMLTPKEHIAAKLLAKLKVRPPSPKPSPFPQPWL